MSFYTKVSGIEEFQGSILYTRAKVVKRVCVYMYIYTHTHTHTHTYIYIYTTMVCLNNVKLEASLQ